jgi:hypothetical protein
MKPAPLLMQLWVTRFPNNKNRNLRQTGNTPELPDRIKS